MSTDVETRVLVINTGGTIRMVLHDGVLCPEPNALVKTLRKLPILHDKQYAKKTKLYECYKPEEKTLVLPKSKLDNRVVYTFLEYSPLLDSSNMTSNDWSTIGKDIEKYYEEYDGFVILHGTDTMAYTASALSFMCENLRKPVILTGSQVPIFEMMSDGRDNLLGALLIAGQFVIPEVCLYFHNKLYRGNRVTKVDSESFKAFASPNLPPLASSEIDIKSNSSSSNIYRLYTTGKFTVFTKMNHSVGLLRLFPGITTDTGTDLNKSDYDGHTPLHIAACEGNLKVVDYLLSKGLASMPKIALEIHPFAMPFSSASTWVWRYVCVGMLYNRSFVIHMDVLEVLRKCGAHLSRDELQDTGTELCRGDLEGLKIWKLAGDDMAMSGYDKKTPAEVAKAFERKEVGDSLKAA
ncbi:60 kDa lysophospholipase-like [Garra rufa]|uniref:60 kDa lysophospholipase-like n=1 Tax=Garra rufa TaxID=137080 RepID=UPI003CCE7285